MKYAYYPGCSLSESACEFDASTRAVMSLLGAELTDIPDWTCCGASVMESVGELLAMALPARNLALAERDVSGLDVLAPCSACYLNLKKVEMEASADARLKARLNKALAVEDLQLNDIPRVRHLLDVLANDVPAEALTSKRTADTRDMVVAPYYGCQILRPYKVFDDPERPRTMHRLLDALGVACLDWEEANACCGASLLTTKHEVAVKRVADILRGAEGADVIVTVCPMCQMNLESCQAEAVALTGRKNSVPVMYLPQLMGLVFGLAPADVLLHKNLSPAEPLASRLGPVEPATTEI